MNKRRAIKFIERKFIRFILLIIAVTIVSFILINLSPIDPVGLYLGEVAVSESQRTMLEQYWGVGQPITVKLFNWLISILHGDFGISLIYRISVIKVILEKFSASLILMSISWCFSGLIGFGLGVVAGKNKGSWIDKIIKVYCYILQSSPSFWIGLLMLIIFSVYLGWFPIGFGVPIGSLESNVTIWQWIARLVLPVLTLSMVSIAPIAMYTRNELVNVLSSDYILFAKSRGEFGWDLIERQALRNILLPVVTLQFLSFNELFGGAVLVEQVFSYPGIGQTAVIAGLQSDVPLLLGIIIFSAIFVFTGNLIADIIYYFVDPRIKENETIENY